MTELVFKGMLGIEPLVDACLQERGVADIAHNTKLWHGRLDPWRAPKLVKEVTGACTAFLKDCCWLTSADPCTRYVDTLCGPCIISSPTTLPSVISDSCTDDENICPLGFPCPDKAEVTQVTSSEACHMSQLRAYVITYGDECDHGAPSQGCEWFNCSNKEDCFVVDLPQPGPTYCNVTKIRIYRLETTLDVQNGPAHNSRDHRAQGFSNPAAADAHWFEVGCVPVGTTTFKDDGMDDTIKLADPIVSDDWDEPPCGLVVHGMFDSGALLGSIGNTLRFSEFNTFHAWPCKYEITLDCPIVTACVCDNYAYVFTTRGLEIISDSPEAMDNYCRGKQTVKRALPLCNHKAVVCTSGQVVFASRDGLYRATPDGQVQLLTQRVGPDNWREIDPATIRLGLYGGRILLTSDRFSGLLDIDIHGDGTAATGTLTTLDTCPTCWVNDKYGNVYMLGTDGIYEWDAGDDYMDFRWRSDERNYPGFGYVTAGQVEFTQPFGRKVRNKETIQFILYADGCKVYERQINHSEPFRLPRCRGQTFAIELRGCRSVSSVRLAASIRCMRAVA